MPAVPAPNHFSAKFGPNPATLKMEAALFSETSASTDKITLFRNVDDHSLKIPAIKIRKYIPDILFTCKF
jgi:hypothetical protein